MADDHYATLGVADDATPEEIKVAYRGLAKLCHPDLQPGDKAAEDRFKRISQAYAVLSEPDSRQAYDLTSNFVGGARFGTRRRARTRTYDDDPSYTTYDSAAADSAEERMRRAREARAARAYHVQPPPRAAGWSGGRGGGSTGAMDFDEWNRMHYGSARGTGRRAATAKGTAAAATAAPDATLYYREYARAFREARAASDRRWPLALAGLVAALGVLFVAARKLDQ